MENNLFHAYLTMRNQTYHIVERSLYLAMQSLMTADLTTKNINTLYQISRIIKQRPNASLSDIAEAANFTINTYSKRIQPLIKKGLLDTTKDAADQRIHHLQLTKSGAQQLALYDSLVARLVKKISQSMNVFELLQFIQSLKKVANALSETPSKFPNVFTQTRIIEQAGQALNQIYVKVLERDEKVLSIYFPTLNIRTVRVLIEIYLHSQWGPVTHSDLYGYLGVPKPTLSRIINQHPAYIHKKTDKSDHRVVYLSVKPKWHPGLEAFMEGRLQTYEDTKTAVKKSAFKRILKVYQLLDEVLKEVTQKPPYMHDAKSSL